MEDHRLKSLLEYTTFHIGAYITLCGILVGIIGYSTVNSWDHVYKCYLGTVLIMFSLAGAAGGLVGSSIPFYKTFDDFISARLGMFGKQWFQAKHCIHAEHLFFWLGIVVAIVGILSIDSKST